MSDRDFADALYRRARQVLEVAVSDLRPPQSDDGKCAPHVAFDRVAKLDKVCEQLSALSATARASLK